MNNIDGLHGKNTPKIIEASTDFLDKSTDSQTELILQSILVYPNPPTMTRFFLRSKM